MNLQRTIVLVIGLLLIGTSPASARKWTDGTGQFSVEAELVEVKDGNVRLKRQSVAMGWFLDGRVTAVVGTHTHVQTADGRILPGGTAYISDLGMTGPHDSVIGRDKQAVIRGFISGMPERFTVASGDVILHGVAITADTQTGRATAIEPIRVAVDGGN